VWVFFHLPRDADADPLGFENELSYFVLLAFLARLDVFPTEDAAANGTADVTDNMLTGDQIP